VGGMEHYMILWNNKKQKIIRGVRVCAEQKMSENLTTEEMREAIMRVVTSSSNSRKLLLISKSLSFLKTWYTIYGEFDAKATFTDVSYPRNVIQKIHYVLFDQSGCVDNGLLLAGITKLIADEAETKDHVRRIVYGITRSQTLAEAANAITQNKLSLLAKTLLFNLLDEDERDVHPLKYMIEMESISETQMSVMAGILGLPPCQSNIYDIAGACVDMDPRSRERNTLLAYLKMI